MRESKSDQAYQLIKSDILTCVFEPGEQIAQPHLAERYDIGMTPVREALHRLAQEGFVEAVPRYGYVVAPITYSTVVDLYEVRTILECAAARLAAQRASDEQLVKVLDSQDFSEYGQDRESYLRFLSRNADFHRNIAEAAGNQKLVEMIVRLHEESLRVLHLGYDLVDSIEPMRQEHITIAIALRDRDAPRAEELVRKHVARTQQRVMEALADRLGLRSPMALQQGFSG